MVWVGQISEGASPRTIPLAFVSCLSFVWFSEGWDFQGRRATGRNLIDPVSPPGSDPEHRDSADHRAVQAGDLDAGAVLLPTEGALDLGTRGGLASEEQDSGLCLGCLGGGGGGRFQRLEGSHGVRRGEVTSGNLPKEIDARGVEVNLLDLGDERDIGTGHRCGGVEPLDGEGDEIVGVLEGGDRSGDAGSGQDKEVSHGGIPGSGVARLSRGEGAEGVYLPLTPIM